MRLLLRAVVFSTLISISASKAVRKARREAEEEHSPLRLEHDNFVVRENDKLMISCVYDGADINEMGDLKWLTSSDQQIDGESSSSVFTIALHEHGTQHKKKTLHFTEIKKRDAGVYVCQAKNTEGKMFRKKVHINVLDGIEWGNNETRVGGLVGEPLTVDCGAKGTPEPQVQITDKEGEPLDDTLFTIAGTEVSVSSLTKQYNGLVVNCVALQILDDLDTTSTEQRSVTIDVWFAPEFESERIDRHTVLQRTAILPCNVTESNPPARHFNFFRNGVLLTEENKYEIVMDMAENEAYLRVKDVGEEDLGEYQCEVNNGRAKATQTINLKEASPPDEVKVSLESVKKHGLVWKIQTDEEDELPASKIEILYLRKELIDKEDEEGEDLDKEQVWAVHGSKAHRSIAEDDLYDIGGLRANSDYLFRFRAESEAGYGPSVEIGASTNEEVNTPVSDSNPLRILLSVFVLVFTVLFL